MPEPAKTAIVLVVSCFTAAAIWILVAQAFGRLRGRRIWTTFLVEILVLAAVFVPAFAGPAWFGAAMLLIGVACVREAAHALTHTRWVVLVYPGVFVLFLLALGSSPTGFADVFFCYAMVELNDSCAYLAGATFGRQRPFPNLSPGKTVAGLVGGPVLTVALAPFFHFALPGLRLTELLAAAALLAILGTVGDLVASAIKRAAGIKDFGTLVPTHGGVLDVYDSLIFVAPFFHGYLTVCRA